MLLEDFLKKYGHLRPGTYDPLQPRYDQNPEVYLNLNKKISSNQTLKKDFMIDDFFNKNEIKQIKKFLDNFKINPNRTFF